MPGSRRARPSSTSTADLKRNGPSGQPSTNMGRRFGRKPFGYFEGEQEAILRMRSLREKGLGFDRIAAELNKEGIPTRTGKTWHGIVVNRILCRSRLPDIYFFR